jgi:hypothetical protein
MIRIKIKQPKSLLVLNALVLETGKTFFVIQIFFFIAKKRKENKSSGNLFRKKEV